MIKHYRHLAEEYYNGGEPDYERIAEVRDQALMQKAVTALGLQGTSLVGGATGGAIIASKRLEAEKDRLNAELLACKNDNCREIIKKRISKLGSNAGTKVAGGLLGSHLTLAATAPIATNMVSPWDTSLQVGRSIGGAAGTIGGITLASKLHDAKRARLEAEYMACKTKECKAVVGAKLDSMFKPITHKVLGGMAGSLTGNAIGSVVGAAMGPIK